MIIDSRLQQRDWSGGNVGQLARGSGSESSTTVSVGDDDTAGTAARSRCDWCATAKPQVTRSHHAFAEALRYPRCADGPLRATERRHRSAKLRLSANSASGREIAYLPVYSPVIASNDNRTCTFTPRVDLCDRVHGRGVACRFMGGGSATSKNDAGMQRKFNDDPASTAALRRQAVGPADGADNNPSRFVRSYYFCCGPIGIRCPRARRRMESHQHGQTRTRPAHRNRVLLRGGRTRVADPGGRRTSWRRGHCHVGNAPAYCSTAPPLTVLLDLTHWGFSPFGDNRQRCRRRPTSKRTAHDWPPHR